jgi:hypothetical protein
MREARAGGQKGRRRAGSAGRGAVPCLRQLAKWHGNNRLEQGQTDERPKTGTRLKEARGERRISCGNEEYEAVGEVRVCSRFQSWPQVKIGDWLASVCVWMYVSRGHQASNLRRCDPKTRSAINAPKVPTGV